jgi:hypothetical protein
MNTFRFDTNPGTPIIHVEERACVLCVYNAHIIQRDIGIVLEEKKICIILYYVLFRLFPYR